jgi:hypothetical protein
MKRPLWFRLMLKEHKSVLVPRLTWPLGLVLFLAQTSWKHRND